jgi:hypothetical protein
VDIADLAVITSKVDAVTLAKMADVTASFFIENCGYRCS